MNLEKEVSHAHCRIENEELGEKHKGNSYILNVPPNLLFVPVDFTLINQIMESVDGGEGVSFYGESGFVFSALYLSTSAAEPFCYAVSLIIFFIS